jgi:hypothetical protein
MTIETNCPKCGKPLTFDLGNVQGVIADLLKRLAQQVVCDACTGSERKRPAQKPVAPKAGPRLPYADD